MLKMQLNVFVHSFIPNRFFKVHSVAASATMQWPDSYIDVDNEASEREKALI